MLISKSILIIGIISMVGCITAPPSSHLQECKSMCNSGTVTEFRGLEVKCVCNSDFSLED